MWRTVKSGAGWAGEGQDKSPRSCTVHGARAHTQHLRALYRLDLVNFTGVHTCAFSSHQVSSHKTGGTSDNKLIIAQGRFSPRKMELK
ncbi:hypothetical protein RRG08_001530 [Elysia crispata]|uniref:Uncharacterized protein n=1 Tax=Elysia crispata TaxID=231223 RepID=A0AAE1AAC9_9GAST|nr:hypothetical protein RRG08_001530 [Elysia crispata]